MSACIESDGGPYSPSIPSSSMDESFQILSRDSVEISDNDAVLQSRQENVLISLEVQEDSAPSHFDEITEEAG